MGIVFQTWNWISSSTTTSSNVWGGRVQKTVKFKIRRIRKATLNLPALGLKGIEDPETWTATLKEISVKLSKYELLEPTAKGIFERTVGRDNLKT